MWAKEKSALGGIVIHYFEWDFRTEIRKSRLTQIEIGAPIKDVPPKIFLEGFICVGGGGGSALIMPMNGFHGTVKRVVATGSSAVKDERGQGVLQHIKLESRL